MTNAAPRTNAKARSAAKAAMVTTCQFAMTQVICGLTATPTLSLVGLHSSWRERTR